MSYSQITLVGNCGRLPELRYLQNGTAVTDFSLAVDSSYTKDGQRVERTDWYRITCWRRQAETVAQYVKKGGKVMVIGSRVEANAYEGKDGQPRASLDVTADRVVFLGGGAGSQGGADVGPPQENEIPF